MAQDRVPITASESVVTPSWTGTWKYHFTIEQPKISAAECTEMADALAAVRGSVPNDALEGLVREAQAFRDLAASGGRPGVRSESMVTFVVADAKTFYERTDVDGGWQKDAERGYTEQVLRPGGDLLWTRRDSSRTAGFAQPFFVDRVAAEQEADNALLACETRQHVLAIDYCARRGQRAEGKQVWVVSRESYAKDPPCGLALLYVGTTMVMRRTQARGRASYVVTMFDGTGRTCKEWVSEWVGGRPRSLEEREFFSVGSAVNARRSLKVVDFAADSRVPDVVELAMTPFEKRAALDYRQPGSPAFDPAAGAPDLGGMTHAQLEAARVEKARLVERQAAGDAMQRSKVPAAGDRRSRRVAATAPKAIPVHRTAGGGHSTPAPLLAALLLAAVAMAGWWRWRRVRGSAAVVAALLLLAMLLPLAGCGQVGAQAGAGKPATAAAAAEVPMPLEVVPAVVHVAKSQVKGERRRYELAVLNNLAEPIEVVSVLPSCGCVGIDEAVQGLRLEPFDGKSFYIWIEMDDFRSVNLEVNWKRGDVPNGMQQHLARLVLET